MRVRPGLESLESRTLLSGSSLLPGDDVNHRATQQVESAYAIVNPMGLPVVDNAPPANAPQNATVSATHFMSATESSTTPQAPTGPPTNSVHGPLLVAPRIYGNTGGILPPPPPPEVHTSESAPEQAPAPSAGPTSINQSNGQSNGAKSPDKAPQQSTEEDPGDTSAWSPAAAEAMPWAVLDACFAHEVWALPIDMACEELLIEPSRSSDLDRLVAAVGLAATAHYAYVEPDTRAHVVPGRRAAVVSPS